MTSEERVAALIPVPAPDAHKYSRGKAVVVAGAPAYPGAACLAAKAAQLSGAGYTQVFTALGNVSVVQAWRPSLVVSSFGAFDAATAVAEGHKGAIVMGPGFPPSDRDLEKVVRQAVRKARVPILIDGGALDALANRKAHEALHHRREKGRATVLTPHEGEAKRLGDPFGIMLREERGGDRFEARKTFAHALSLCYESTIVLKGPDTVIASADGGVEVVTAGTPALAKAGTGDVLAGLIGGLLAQGLSADDAAFAGVWLHARAGVVASERHGVVSCCAEEVLDALPAAIMRVQGAAGRVD